MKQTRGCVEQAIGMSWVLEREISWTYKVGSSQHKDSI